MNKTIFALQGPGNAGKTTTIRMAYMMCRPSDTPVCDDFVADDDFICTLNLNGVKVGFASGGDWPSAVKGALDKLVECQIIVCATRTRGGTVTEVNKFTRKHECKTYWIRQCRIDPFHGQSWASGDVEKKTGRRTKAIAELIVDFVRDCAQSKIPG